MVWNTFATRARCPGCRNQWRITIWLACYASPLHEDWYHDEATDSHEYAVATEREEKLAEVGAALRLAWRCSGRASSSNIEPPVRIATESFGRPPA